MGAMGESITQYAQPLVDGTDGSAEQLNHALELAMVCWNLSLLPEEARHTALLEMRPAMEMSEADFEAFLRSVILPMIRRHEEMFPRMHEAGSTAPSAVGRQARATHGLAGSTAHRHSSAP